MGRSIPEAQVRSSSTPFTVFKFVSNPSPANTRRNFPRTKRGGTLKTGRFEHIRL